MKNNDKPTKEEYYENGNIKYQTWFKNDQCHRTNGLPAWIHYSSNGNIDYQEWYINGNQLSDKEVYQLQFKWIHNLLILNKEGIEYYENQ